MTRQRPEDAARTTHSPNPASIDPNPTQRHTAAHTAAGGPVNSQLTPEQRTLRGMAEAAGASIAELEAAMARIAHSATVSAGHIRGMAAAGLAVPPHVIEAMVTAEIAARNAPKEEA